MKKFINILNIIVFFDRVIKEGNSDRISKFSKEYVCNILKSSKESHIVGNDNHNDSTIASKNSQDDFN